MRRDPADSVRPILQALARVIVSDRRAVALASQKAEILLANPPARRLGIAQDTLTARFDWPALCIRARRAGSLTIDWQESGHSFDGELVHVPLGPADGFLLRLSESDQESTWLRNRARAATLLRVAHDLRTPIQSLLAAAEALAPRAPASGGSQPAGEIAGETDSAKAGIRRAAELALDHISNVLAVIRGEQNRKGGQPDEDFRIVEEVASLIALVRPIAEARATELHLTIEAPRDLTLHGPVRFIRALCQNLIDNSVNHGGGRVELRLSCSPLAAPLPVTDPITDPATGPATGPDAEIWRVRLDLLDEGGGLPAAQRARLSEALGLPMDDPGPQISSQDGRPSAGLNVLAHALRQLGGHITIKDRGRDGGPVTPGGDSRVIGTIFTVIFSLPGSLRASPPAEPSGLTASRPADPARTPLAGRRILLVEDSPSSRDWLTHVLQAAGAEAHPVGSGPEALAFLSRSDNAAEVDLVLTDVTLPRMTGIELAARLRAGDPAAATPWRGKVVGLTAHADERVRAACLRAGMVRVLEKPIQPATLSHALAEVLNEEAEGAPPPGPASPPRPIPLEAPLNPAVTADLIAQIGLDSTRNFMRRALSEAGSVLDDLLAEGVGPDTGRRLHAATGACGLTGLQMVEKYLREIEQRVNRNRTVPAALTDALSAALKQTAVQIAEIAA
ncbi:hybrid sensor histidine kinase/response regulator [Szabonella alba]|uniref:histidine kinase n=1 Tax=Szabonella alba TaxID=2804194 RepID=A0A8K0VHP9_9RHOB|nr:response regulator [Szabonella alba]MBL4919420.1 response regulator [Szabonella alba]